MSGAADGAVLSTEMVPLADLRPYPGNPRNGDIDAIAESLRLHGQYRALVVNKPTMEVLAGNHTMHALMQNGETHALVHFVDVSQVEAAKIVLVDNRLNDVAKQDEGLLASLLQSLPDLSGTGYGEADLNKLLADDGPAKDQSAELSGSYSVMVTCTDEAAQAALLERLGGEGYTCKALFT